MTKSVLEQYIDLTIEIEELESKIKKLEDRLERINKEGDVKDTVKGGDGGLKTFHLEGFPVAEEDEVKYLLRKHIRVLKDRQDKAREMVVSVERYLNTLDDSRMRRMITYRYIEGYPWWKVAQCMGKQYTEDSCKKQMERFLKKI